MSELSEDVGVIRQRVVAIIVDQLGVPKEKVTDQAKVVDDLGADSLGLVEMVMALEEEFTIEIPEEDMKKIVTVGDAIDFVTNAL